jgi:D-sedoheptulose 7-phosphate isomerase
MSDNQFIKNYLQDFISALEPDSLTVDNLIEVRDLILKVKSNNKKVLIFGNGGSAAIASHFSVDITKNGKIRCDNFNEAGIITCFSNDYGFEHWAEKAVDFYGDKGDLLIVISSSGQSINMINAVEAARHGDFQSVITLTGFSEQNPLSKIGDINLWVDNKSYNFVENIHQIWLLAIVDLIIGKREYSA